MNLTENAIVYTNFALIILIIGVVIWQSIKVETISTRLADFENQYARDQLKYVRSIRDIQSKTKDIVSVLELQATNKK